jgi:hypothetical protein
LAQVTIPFFWSRPICQELVNILLRLAQCHFSGICNGIGGMNIFSVLAIISKNG